MRNVDIGRVATRWMGKVALDYKTWKRQNVTLRGMADIRAHNGVWGSFGKGLYTVPLGNRAMARQYGDVYFVINAIPQRPKIVQSLNAAELLRQDLAEEFCKKHGQPLSMRFFNDGTTMDAEMLALGYDGLIIKGREMVNYTPKNIQYFRTEGELMQYFNSQGG